MEFQMASTSTISLPAAAPRGRRHSGLAVGVVPLGLLVLALACFSAVLWGGVETGQTALVLSSVGGLASAILIQRAIRVLAPTLLTPQLLALSSSLQVLWVFLLAVLGLPTVLYSSTFTPDLASNPLRAVLPLLLLPLGALLATGAARLLGVRARSLRVLFSAERAPVGMGLYLSFSALLLLLYWPAALAEAGVVGYGIRVLYKATLLVPFLAGRYQGDLRGVRYLWYAALCLNAGVGMVVGSRFVAFLPVVLYFAGYLAGLPAARRRRAIRLSALVAIPGLLLVGLLGIIRDEIGRGGVEVLSPERIVEVASQVGDKLEDMADLADKAAFVGIYRMLGASNVAVPVLSPDAVPYRGMDGLGEQIVSGMQISALTGQTKVQYLDAGLGSGPARAYGFTVDEHTSVEFGVLPDGWSRGGPWVALIYACVLATLLIAAECLVWQVFRGNPAAVLLLLLVIGRAAFFDTAALPLVETIRSLLLSMAVVLLTILGLELLPRKRGATLARSSP